MGWGRRRAPGRPPQDPRRAHSGNGCRSLRALEGGHHRPAGGELCGRRATRSLPRGRGGGRARLDRARAMINRIRVDAPRAARPIAGLGEVGRGEVAAVDAARVRRAGLCSTPFERYVRAWRAVRAVGGGRGKATARPLAGSSARRKPRVCQAAPRHSSPRNGSRSRPPRRPAELGRALTSRLETTVGAPAARGARPARAWPRRERPCIGGLSSPRASHCARIGAIDCQQLIHAGRRRRRGAPRAAGDSNPYTCAGGRGGARCRPRPPPRHKRS
jgi:hypothetical protein